MAWGELRGIRMCNCQWELFSANFVPAPQRRSAAIWVKGLKKKFLPSRLFPEKFYLKTSTKRIKTLTMVHKASVSDNSASSIGVWVLFSNRRSKEVWRFPDLFRFHAHPLSSDFFLNYNYAGTWFLPGHFCPGIYVPKGTYMSRTIILCRGVPFVPLTF